MIALALTNGEARGGGYLLLTAGGGFGGTAGAGSLGLEGGWRGNRTLLGVGLAGIFAGGDWETAGDNPLMTYEMKRNADLEVCAAIGAALTRNWYLVGTAGWSFDSTTGRTTFNSGTPVEWDPVFGDGVFTWSGLLQHERDHLILGGGFHHRRGLVGRVGYGF